MDNRKIVSIYVVDVDQTVTQAEQQLVLGYHIDLGDGFLAEILIVLQQLQIHFPFAGTLFDGIHEQMALSSAKQYMII